MGRDAGFIAMCASSASRDVNICLVPEFQFELQGEHGLLNYIYNRLYNRRHCVLVVAEGAGEAMLDGAVEHSGQDNVGHVKYGVSLIYLGHRTLPKRTYSQVLQGERHGMHFEIY